MNHLLAILEPQLEGEIAIRRQTAGDGRGLEQTDAPTEPLRAPVSAPGERLQSPVRVADFERIEDYLHAYLEDERFRAAHPLAYGRWLIAWEMLWCADSRARVIAVARRAHDAMQAFSASMLERCAPLPMDAHWPAVLADGSIQPEPLEGLTSVTEIYREALGEQRSELLDGMLEHWTALLHTVQRHAGDSPAPHERLQWEDGRRLVLFTALVMVETDRSFA